MENKEYLASLIDIHGENYFGIHETRTINSDNDQKIELQCWGCCGSGYKLWSESWTEHFTHDSDCAYLKLKKEITTK